MLMYLCKANSRRPRELSVLAALVFVHFVIMNQNVIHMYVIFTVYIRTCMGHVLYVVSNTCILVVYG